MKQSMRIAKRITYNTTKRIGYREYKPDPRICKDCPLLLKCTRSANAKQLHGYRYARLRGLDKVKEQCLLAAACQNMKKIAQVKARETFLSLIPWLPRAVSRIRHSRLDTTMRWQEQRYFVVPA